MYVSAKAEYALRALVALAAAGRPMTADELARSQDLPASYLEAILVDLRRRGIIISRRGPSPGYRFVRPPDEVTPADVIRIVDGPLAEIRGIRPEATSYTEEVGALQLLWVALRTSLRRVLEGVTIAQLAEGRLPRNLRSLVADPEAWRPR
ncbi:MAG TPA: Rrf2 family transcriptional regulator [Acidimicrobiales bacterium]|nr:Rrf2 family transcriptional regulator [Acidimicrobiales bacterium]